MLSSTFCHSQGDCPEWSNVDNRRLAFPDKTYFTGYAVGQQDNGESISDAVARIENNARADAASHIEVKVESSTINNVESLQKEGREGLDESIQSYFSQTSRTSTTIQIPNLQVLSWHSLNGDEIIALAYVKKKDFARYHDRQIELLLGKMEDAHISATEQEHQGSKMKAIRIAGEALQKCPQVEYNQRMLALADSETTVEDLQMERYKTIVRNLAAVISRLKNATAFFIICNTSTHNEDHVTFDREVRGKLSEHGCNFVDNRDDADWIIEIDANVINTTHRDGMAFFVYVDGTLSIQNGTTKQIILKGRLSTLEDGHYDGIKGGDFNVERATRIAYKNTAQIVADVIMKQIQK